MSILNIVSIDRILHQLKFSFVVKVKETFSNELKLKVFRLALKKCTKLLKVKKSGTMW